MKMGPKWFFQVDIESKIVNEKEKSQARFMSYCNVIG